jgi:hypothetical protein
MPLVVIDSRGKVNIGTIIHPHIPIVDAKLKNVTATIIRCNHVALSRLPGSDPRTKRNIVACYVIDNAVNNDIVITRKIQCTTYKPINSYWGTSELAIIAVTGKIKDCAAASFVKLPVADKVRIGNGDNR